MNKLQFLTYSLTIFWVGIMIGFLWGIERRG